jgi:arsenate reductase
MPREMSGTPYNVLFLCTGNSARSIIAECLLNRLGEGRFRAYSAGSFPRGTLNPLALGLLSREGFDTSALRSKSWDEYATPDAPRLDFVFTVCDDAAGEVCPVWPGQPVTAHWGVPDPASVTGSDVQRAFAFADTYRALSNRISAFVSLPIAKLDRMTLAHRLHEIGRSTD